MNTLVRLDTQTTNRHLIATAGTHGSWPMRRMQYYILDEALWCPDLLSSLTEGRREVLHIERWFRPVCSHGGSGR